jgi:hypothetical protein
MMRPESSRKVRGVDDPVPDPEPASPSLPGPDLGVFHHEPGEGEAEGDGEGVEGDAA